MSDLLFQLLLSLLLSLLLELLFQSSLVEYFQFVQKKVENIWVNL